MFVFLKKEGEERPREWGTENLLQKNAPVPSSSSFTVNPFSLSFSFSLPFRSSPFFSLSFSFSLPFRSPFSFSFSFSFSLPFPFSLPFRSFFFSVPLPFPFSLPFRSFFFSPSPLSVRALFLNISGYFSYYFFYYYFFSKWFRAVNKIFDSFSLLLFLLNILFFEIKLILKLNLVSNKTEYLF